MSIFAHFLAYAALFGAAAPAGAAEPEAADDPPKVYPAEVIHLGEPPKDPVLQHLELIEEQNWRLEKRIDELEALLVERTKEPPERVFEGGLTLALRDGDLGRLVIDANVKYLAGYLFAKSGAGIAVVPTIDAWRMRIHPISAGLVWYFDKRKPLSVEYIPREWDLLFSTGADMVVWRGLQVRFQIMWLFPNPSDVTQFAAKRARQDWRKMREAAERRVKEGRDAAEADDVTEAKDGLADDMETFGHDMENDADIFSKAYKNAGRRPFYLIGLRWEF